jgi:acetyltransferase-like isoleucine patch superfamily enzyme
MQLKDYIKQFYRDYRVRKALAARFPTLVMEQNVLFKGDFNNLKVGKNVLLQYGAYLHLGGMEWCQNEGCIEIGDDSVISPYCILYGGGPGGIHTGKEFNCGPGVGIFASRSDYTKGIKFHKFKPITIGDNVMVGANAVINTGVRIGSNVVISANSFVNRPIPDGVLVSGNPAKVIRDL